MNFSKNIRVFAILAAMLFTSATAASAADSAIKGYEPERWVVSGSLGLGLANTYGTGGTPLFAATAEYGVTPKVSIGGSAGFASSTYDYFDYSAKYSYSVVAARGSYHLGVKETGATAFGYDIGASYMLYGVYGGARWYFNPKAAVFAEAGYGLGELALGASIRL